MPEARDDHDWPDPMVGQYELRVTHRARADLGAKACPARELTQIEHATKWPAIVKKFGKQRALDPNGTEDPLHSMDCPDVYGLHGPDGQRAATWYDQTHQVVWLLGFTPEHDYTLLEERAVNDELLPDAHDYQELFDDRDAPVSLADVIMGAVKLAEVAMAEPGALAYGTAGGVLKMEARVVGGKLHVRLVMPPLTAGVLTDGFVWAIAGAIAGVELDSFEMTTFPGRGERQQDEFALALSEPRSGAL